MSTTTTSRPRTRRHRPLRRAGGAAFAAALALGVVVAPSEATSRGHERQPALSTRSVPIISVHGLKFRDLDRNGRLTPYEDWRLSPSARARDLLGRMTLEQKAGLMVHGTLPASGSGYDPAGTTTLVADRSITTMITRLAADPAAMATASNSVQAIAENQPLGIPVVISSDPRNGFSVTGGQTVARVGTTAMPDAIGQGAIGDAATIRELGDIVRAEYRAVGITEALSPQADIATEPRWTRINGTFGSDSATVKKLVKAYVAGLQEGTHGLTSDSVATVTKHWVGYGAQENGFDSHYYYGRYATFPGNNFAEHIVPFTGAFAADTAGVMPTYSILKDLVYRGTALPQVGAGFSSFLLQDLLRGRYGFDGVIVSDWGITGDCPTACQENRPPAFFVGPWGVGMPWGVEDKTVLQRFALTINAGVDQVGGSDEPSYVVQAVADGLVTRARVDAAARRVLVQKFELGLFESPFVSPTKAASIAGNAAFARVGDAAQAASLTLLSNAGDLLPAAPADHANVYLSGVSPDAATAAGYTVVTDLADADLAVVRLSDPRGGPDLTDLDFAGTEPDYTAFQAAVDSGVPTVAVPKLDRPLVLGNVVDRAGAVLANYGVSDEVLLQTIAGERRPGGSLPFELPSSMAAVEAQLADVADDSVDPLFPAGFGLEYAAPTIDQLRGTLADLRAAGDVSRSAARALDARLASVERSLDRGREQQAVRGLEQFVRTVETWSGGRHVSVAAGDRLVGDAQTLIASLR
ncbi:glycoside hydrolase family 3 protein [Cellulomonas sp. PhB150]|uniref:glycoside hydrolase family 3 protein n=1 Tax=Cellulomonas sp. PhB150 TaxID=2485188 RepID=UPI000F4812CA|nr:glycoside hydrolase family 3 N-terminal domain-containing protein [Cellulomonas sp. PhB150]ROS30993.1 beta-glucosidase [Cellulomonas sp. PhB150]